VNFGLELDRLRLSGLVSDTSGLCRQESSVVRGGSAASSDFGLIDDWSSGCFRKRSGGSSRLNLLGGKNGEKQQQCD
jgi:hypothetical protein